MKLILITFLFSSIGIAADKSYENEAKNICANNFTGFIHMIDSDKSKLSKNPLVNKSVDEELRKAYLQLQVLKDPLYSSEAKVIYKKIVPLLEKNVKDFHLCTTMMVSINNGHKVVCPNLKPTAPQYSVKVDKCTQAAAELPDVKVDVDLWKKALQAMFKKMQ